MNQLKPEVLSLVKVLSEKPVGFVAVINRDNIPSRLAASMPGEFLPISILRYRSRLIEIVYVQVGKCIVQAGSIRNCTRKRCLK